MLGILGGEGKQENKNEVQEMENYGAEAGSAVKLLEELLNLGYRKNASDIHLEPQEDRMVVRMRLDGMLLHVRDCRLAYEAGFSPICPLLYLPLFLNDSVPEEHKAGIDMRRDMLRRSHTLIVCGSVVDEDVKNDIAIAGRLGIAATTLEGVLAVKGHGTPGHAGY